MGIRRVSATAVWTWLAATTWLVVVAVIRPFRRAYADRDFRAAFEWGLLFTGGLVLIFVLPHQISSDGYVRYFALAKLIEWREPSSTLYSFVGPLSSAPLYFRL
jgi:hypothetical protein